MSQKRTTVRRKPLSEINVVPYIDVMLVLLVVFMITAPMMTSGIKVDLPDARAEPLTLPKDQQFVIVSVDHNGQYYVSTAEDKQTPKALPDIVASVAALKQEKPDTPVLMEGDERVAYGLVMRMMIALQEAGINDVGLVTEDNGRE
ncbi:MAG: protein TolR [Pseudomonadota bacterium]|nr:protein TolR [Pseudomonadales bacterium]MDY6922229.1 protein TolR [Pseudomonadota bacterium]|tara:strand:+ start:23 stop:460 length:438 start_codon:yes stop_codon:yes gene_type:complete